MFGFLFTLNLAPKIGTIFDYCFSLNFIYGMKFSKNDLQSQESQMAKNDESE